MIKEYGWIVVIGVIVLGLLGLIIYDHTGEHKVAKGVIEDKEHIPAHTTVTFDPDNNPIINHYPDQWHIVIRTSDRADKIVIDVDLSEYGKHFHGDKVNIAYTEGKLSHGYLAPRILPPIEKE